MVDNGKITPDNEELNNYRRAVYENHLRRRQEHLRKQSLMLKCLVSGFVLLIVIVAGLVLMSDNAEFWTKSFGKDSAITKLFAKTAQENSQKKKADFSFPFGMRRQNILFLGVDASENPNDLWTGTRTDTLILVNVDPRTKSVNAVSIPRDSKVYLSEGRGVQKINAAHAIGGLGMTIETVERTLGVKVDRYIMVHDDAVKAIVEALGGVDVYVEKPMRYHDYTARLHINLSKGVHRLTPNEVVGYLRFRHDPLGDIGRTQRQQWFLRGLLHELQKPETIAKIPDIISATHKYVKTNMSLYELSQYASLSKHIDIDKMEVAMLPGGPNKKGAISYWILDPEKTQEVINRLIYREKVVPQENLELSAGLMFSESNTAKAEVLQSELEAMGVKIACTGNLSRTHTQFVAHSNTVTMDYFNWLKKQVPSVNGFQFVYEPINYYCGKTDFTIILTGN